MGDCPDWYATIQAAKYLNCAPWELIEQSIYWQDKAFVGMDGESQAQDTLKAQGR